MQKVRLQKYFTDCGVMSRRAAEEQIRLGRVKVNGVTASLGDSVIPYIDKVELDGRPVVPLCEEHICIMLNKPRGYVTTMSDERGRKNVSALVSDLGLRVYPVGRLDMDSEGLLLLTNDGALANRLTHPKHEIAKIYHVTVGGAVSASALDKLRSALVIDGYKITPVDAKIISRTESGNTVIEMPLYEGRNRQIRKMCDISGLCVKRLRRVAIGNIRLGQLRLGKWRRLSRGELAYLCGEADTKGDKNA